MHARLGRTLTIVSAIYGHGESDWRQAEKIARRFWEPHEVGFVLDRLIEEARRKLSTESAWNAVTALAERLMNGDVLYGAEVLRLVVEMNGVGADWIDAAIKTFGSPEGPAHGTLIHAGTFAASGSPSNPQPER